MQFRLKVTTGNETSSVFISMGDAEHIAGRSLVLNAKEGDVLKITRTMKIEILP